jgi:predicted acyltransferase
MLLLEKQQPARSSGAPPETPRDFDRLASLDALRGFAMFWIVGGSAIFKGLARAFPGRFADACSSQLEHVAWQGLHFYDVIWPLFLFIVGLAMRLSLARRRARGKSDRAFSAHALRRAAILFVLGMVAQGNVLAFDWSSLHPCYSVLHGIAAGYLIATVAMVNLRPRSQAIATAACLLSYWALLTLIPVPGFGAGVLTPAGNTAAYVDRLVLGHFQYGTNTWFLSYLGFASSVLLGGLAGDWLLSPRSQRTKAAGLFGAGAALLLAGFVWSIWFPIIKLLWTGSYCLVAGGISFLLMGVFYTIVDVLGFRKWAFGLTVIGMNSIAAYMATMLFDFRHVGNIFVGNLLPRVGDWSGFLEASAAFVVVWLILYWMYRTRSFLKV